MRSRNPRFAPAGPALRPCASFNVPVALMVSESPGRRSTPVSVHASVALTSSSLAVCAKSARDRQSATDAAVLRDSKNGYRIRIQCSAPKWGCVKPFWTGFLLSVSLCLDLGVVNVAIFRMTLEHGARDGFLLGAGSLIGDLIYFTLALYGATALLEYRPVRWILWAGGTAVLLWLAWKMIRESFRQTQLEEKFPIVPM